MSSDDDEFEPVEPRDQNIRPRNVVDWVNFSRRRGVSMWAWILHRITAVLTVVVLSLHILRNQFGFITPGGRLVAIDFLLTLVVYHGLNGVRVVVIETWGLAAEQSDRLFWVVVGLTLVFLTWWIIYVGL